MQLPLLTIGVLAVVLLARQRSYSSVGISAILAVLWVWQALAYHLAFFTAINPLAYAFAGLFIAAAVTFLWQGVVCNRLIFKITTGWRVHAGWGLMVAGVIGIALLMQSKVAGVTLSKT